MPRRELDFPDLSAALADARRLHEHGYDKAGRWNLAMACDHLSRGIDMTIDGFPFRPALPLRIIGRVVFKRIIFKTRRIKAGVKGPASMDPHDGDEAKSVAELARAAERFRAHTGAFYPSPFLGPLSKEEWAQFHAIHAAHHLSFLLPK